MFGFSVFSLFMQSLPLASPSAVGASPSAVGAVDSVPFPPPLFRAWYSKALKPIVYFEPADDFTESLGLCSNFYCGYFNDNQRAEIRRGEQQTRAGGFLIALISATKKPVERSCEVMQIQSRCSSWAGLVPDLCLDEKCAPWISLASGGGGKFGGMLVAPQRDSVSAGDSPQSGTAAEQLLLSEPSCS